MKFKELDFKYNSVYNKDIAYWNDQNYMVRIIKDISKCSFYLDYHIIGSSDGGIMRLKNEQEVEDFMNNLINKKI